MHASLKMPLSIIPYQNVPPSGGLTRVAEQWPSKRAHNQTLTVIASLSQNASFDYPLSKCASVRWTHSRSRAVALKRAHNKTLTVNACLSQNASINLPL
jgi:hypothetical protein